MSDSAWSVQDAKNKFSAVLEAAQSEPQTITRHGKPAAVLVSPGEYARLKRIERTKKPSFADFLLSMPRGDVDFERPNIKPRDVEF